MSYTLRDLVPFAGPPAWQPSGFDHRLLTPNQAIAWHGSAVRELDALQEECFEIGVDLYHERPAFDEAEYDEYTSSLAKVQTECESRLLWHGPRLAESV